jgi:Zn-dependent protease with chaperone function
VHLPTEQEVKVGRETADEIEKQYRVIPSGPIHDRLQRVAADVVRAIQRPEIAAEYRSVYRLPRKDDKSRRVPFEFSFKLVDGKKEINAFSLAGGPVYVTRALMEYTPSDHELAGVLAHEVTHVTFHHVEQLLKKQRKLSGAQLWGLLAVVAASVAGGGAGASAAGNLLIGSQLVSIATLNGYGRELETEADRIGVMALSYTPYQPLGMLTFMQKLAREDRLRGNPDLGIYQSHPYSNERVASIRVEVERLGFRVDAGAERRVSGAFRVASEPMVLNGQDAANVLLNGSLVVTVVDWDGDVRPGDRASRIASQLETLIHENAGINDVRVSDDKTAVLIRGIPVIRVLPKDAQVLGSAAAVTDRAAREILRALLKERLGR